MKLLNYWIISAVVFSCFLFYGCLGDNHVSLDSITKSIPREKSGEFRSYYYQKKRIEKIIKIDSIENGFDNYQLRVWYGHTLYDSLNLIIVSRTNSEIEGLLYTISIKKHFSDSSDKISLLSKRSLIPKTPGLILDSLISISELNDMFSSEDIPTYNSCADGDYLLIEIATRSKYKIMSFPCHKENLETEEAKQIVKLLHKLDTEFTSSGSIFYNK